MTSTNVPQVSIQSTGQGACTALFEAAFPTNFTISRIPLYLPPSGDVTVTSGQKAAAVFHEHTTALDARQFGSLGAGMLKLIGRCGNASKVLHGVLPVFRVNPVLSEVKPWDFVWFGRRGELEGANADIGRLIQDLAFLGRDATTEGGLRMLEGLAGVSDDHPLANVIGPLKYLFGEGVAPHPGELSHLVLEFSARVAGVDAFNRSNGEVYMADIEDAAEAALDYFDANTVVRALVWGGIGAGLNTLDIRSGQIDAVHFYDHLKTLDMHDTTRGMTSRAYAEGLGRLAEKMRDLHRFELFGAGVLLLAGRKYLEAARDDKLIKVQMLEGARAAFDAAHLRILSSVQGSLNDSYLGEYLQSYAKTCSDAIDEAL